MVVFVRQISRLLERLVPALICAALVPQLACAQAPTSVLSSGTVTRCTQPDATTLECDYRLVKPEEVRELGARLGEVDLPVSDFYPFPQPGATAAVLFLIDTSDPNRSAAVRAGLQAIRQMIEAGGPHHTFGIATFDSDLRVVAQLGSSRSQLESALATVRASGRTTELYRNTLAAINLLGEYNAERKKLVLLSDGLAEDRAYFHQDVVNAAARLGISIDGLGYPRSVSLSVALQTLRRLADETGGRFVEGNQRFALQESYLKDPYGSLDNGGTFIVDLSPAVSAGATGQAEVELSFATAGTVYTSRASVMLPTPPPPPPVIVTAPLPPLPAVAPAPAAETSTGAAAGSADTGRDSGSAAAPALPPDPLADSAAREALAAQSDAGTGSQSARAEQAPESSVAAVPGDGAAVAEAPVVPAPPSPVMNSPQPVQIGPIRFSSEHSMQLWLWGAVAVLAVVMLALLWTLLSLIRKRRDRNAAADEELPGADPTSSPQLPGQTFAYLEGVDGGALRYAITSAEFRIGRHDDNELPLDDASISRHHAQVHRKRDGSFSISDLDSMNGVFVNEERVSESPLKEGDLVELGDVRLRFTMASDAPIAGDETVVVRTIAPDKFGTAA